MISLAGQFWRNLAMAIAQPLPINRDSDPLQRIVIYLINSYIPSFCIPSFCHYHRILTKTTLPVGDRTATALTPPYKFCKLHKPLFFRSN